MLFAQGWDAGGGFAILIVGFVAIAAMAVGSMGVALMLWGAYLALEPFDRVSHGNGARRIPPLHVAWAVVAMTIVGVSLLGVVIDPSLGEKMLNSGYPDQSMPVFGCLLGFPVMFPLVVWMFSMKPLRAALVTVIPSALASYLSLPRTENALHFVFEPRTAARTLGDGSMLAIAIVFAVVAIAIWQLPEGWK